MTPSTTGLGPGALLCVPMLLPLAVTGLAAAWGWRPWVARAHVLAALGILAAGVTLAARTTGGRTLAVGDVLRADALSAVMVILIGAVATIATWAGTTFVSDDLERGRCTPRAADRYGMLLPVFLAAMALAVLAANLGVMWAAIEATTVATAFLVGHYRSRAGVEATWKYVIICAVGIALAYLGTVLVYFASRQAGHGHGTLDWAKLAADPNGLDPSVMRIAFALLVIGFGTKAGLIPLHSWLPDAHGQAPAPVSALMSGVLLPVALYALIRHRVLADAVDPAFTRGLLLTVGLGSLAVAASLLLAQRDYKRMLAYSSVEHMGILVLGVGVGGGAMFGALLHLLNNGLTKGVLFLCAGNIHRAFRSKLTTEVSGALRRVPASGALFLAGFFAITGTPPFGPFISELTILRAAMRGDQVWVAAAFLVALTVVFLGMGSTVLQVVQGEPRSGREATDFRDTAFTVGPPLVLLALVLMLGVYIPPPLQALLHEAAVALEPGS